MALQHIIFQLACGHLGHGGSISENGFTRLHVKFGSAEEVGGGEKCNSQQVVLGFKTW